MAKKKQEKPTKIPKAITPQQELIEALKPAFDAIGKRLDHMDQRIKASNTRTSVVAKKASEEPKAIDIMGIFKEINTFLNGPIGTKIVDGILGSGEEAAASPSPPPVTSEAEVKAAAKIRNRNDKIVERWLEALVGEAEAKTKMAKKRAESDFI